MEHKNRFQPYARAAPRRQQPEPAAKPEDVSQIPQVILNIVKKSLGWLGITQEALFPDSHTPAGSDNVPSIQETEAESGESSTGGGAGASHDHAPSSSAVPERLYPDLREYINAKSAPIEERVLNINGKRPDYDEDEEMRPERVERRLWLRKQLMNSLSNSDSRLSVSPMANPFLVPDTVNRNKKSSDFSTQSLENSLASRHDSQEAENVDDDGDLTERELAILGRIRRLTETPLETSKRKTSTKSDPRLLEEVPVRDPPSPYSAIRRIHQEVEPAPRATPKPLDTILPYNKDHRRQRPTVTTRDSNKDHAMNSGDSGSDADESEHATLDLRDRRGSGGHRQSRFREKAPDMVQTSPERRRRTSRPELHDELRTSRGGLQIRSQVTPQRHVRRHIPGRFSALDSDEEEESLRLHDMEKTRRAQEASSTLSSGHGDPHGNHTSKYSGYRQQPQLYPTLQYGQRTKLYNPKLDEVLKWASSTNERSGPAGKPAEHKVSFAESVVSEMKSAAPAVIGTLAAAAAATGAVKMASDWASAGTKLPDYSSRWKCPTCDGHNDEKLEKCASCEAIRPGLKKAEQKAPAMPALFTPSFGSFTPAATTASDKDKENEKDKSATNIWKVPASTDKWKCPTCDVSNDNTLDKCPCCETNKPGTKAAEQKAPSLPSLFSPAAGLTTSSATSAPPLFSFGAPPASLTTKQTPAATDSEKDQAPAKSIWGTQDNTNKWKCGTCDVMNETKDAKCVCCDAPKPGSAPTAAPSLFSFKSPAPTGAPSTPALFSASSTAAGISGAGMVKPTPSLFGGPATPKDSETKPPAFSFGAPASTTPLATPKETGSNPPAFSFDAPSTTAPASGDSSKPASAIAFANPFATKPLASPSSVLFGSSTVPAPSTSGVSSEESNKRKPTFAFGTPVSTTSSSAPLFGATSAATSTPLFGAPAATSTPLFGAPAATSIPLFGAPAATSTPLFGAPATTSTPLFGAPATTSTPLFGAPAATPVSTAISASSSASMFGATSTTAPSTFSFGAGLMTPATSLPASGTPLFSLPTPAASGASSTNTTTSTPAPTLFGAPASAAPGATATSTSASSTVPAFGSVTSSPFSFGSSGSAAPFGQSAATSTPAISMSSSGSGGTGSVPSFTFSGGTTSGTTTPSLTTGSGFNGSGFAGFGAAKTPAATTAAATSAGLTSAAGFAFGGAISNTTSQQPPATFMFGTPSNAGGFGSGAAASTSAPFSFGGNTAGNTATATSTGFGSANNNSMMSPTMSNATPSSSGFGGFGSSTQMPAAGFGTSGPSSGFGSASRSTPSLGFGATTAPGQGSSPFGQSGGFGSKSIGFGGGANPAGTTGFGASTGTGFGGTSGFGAGATGGFGANMNNSNTNSGSSGFISLAGPNASIPAFGAPAGGAAFGAPAGGAGFGGGMMGEQPQTQPQQPGGGFGGFGGGASGGQFGFQGISTAPGGAQYAQPAQAGGMQTGGMQEGMQPQFSFNVGAGPAPGETHPNRKIAKMRSKKR